MSSAGMAAQTPAHKANVPDTLFAKTNMRTMYPCDFCACSSATVLLHI